MIVTESIIWVIVWIIGVMVTVVLFYYMNNKVTLANMVGAVFIWWIIIPLFICASIAVGIMWLITNADEVVLFEKKDWWMTKEDRKRLKNNVTSQDNVREPKKTKEFFDALENATKKNSKFNNNNISEK